MPHLEITDVVLIHCNIINNNCKQDSRVVYIFVPNKSFGLLLDISLNTFLTHNFPKLKYGVQIKVLNC